MRSVSRHATNCVNCDLVAVHMEAMNHCGLGRTALRTAIDAAGLTDRVATPADGETLELSFG